MAPTDPHPHPHPHPHPRAPDLGLVLSPAETDRLRGVLGSAGLTLAVDEHDRDLPASQRLAPRLEQAEHDLLGRLHRAQRATVRLDVPVRLTPAEAATVQDLLAQAADRLDAYAARRAQGQYLLGPDYFRDQATAARAWRADLGQRQAERAVAGREQPTQRGGAGDGR
jgi:hypothetical protein